MKRFFRTPAVRFFAAAMAMLLLGSLLSLALRGGSSPFTSAVGLIASPLQGACAYVSGTVKGFFSYFESSSNLRALLAEKDEEILALREQVVDYEDAKNKLLLYEEFLELKRENPDFQFCDANVIGVEASGDYYASFTLNRGSAHGIKVADPVVCGKKYLVGVVADTTLTSCTVRTVMNPKVSVAVYAPLANETGDARSTIEQAEQGYCAISQLERDTKINTGHLVCTSGIGGIYPKDLILGTVSEVVEGDQSYYLTALIQPAADFSALRDVMVLIEQKGSQP